MTNTGSLPSGYFLGQEAMSVGRNATFRRMDPYFAPFLTEDGVKRYFEQIAGKVDGLDYVNYWYGPEDAETARRVAEIGREHGIDMWAGIRWFKQFRDLPVVPAEYQAWTMDQSGRVFPALWEQRNHIVDYLNPEAIDWLLENLAERYWRHVKGPVNGLFFPECRVTCEVPYGRAGLKPWTLHAYSPYVLSRWREYCADHNVRVSGRVVDRFPVPSATMADGASDSVVYVPDNRPASVPSFTRLEVIPGGAGVWRAWEDFLCGQFHESFVHRIAAWVNRYNSDEPDWRGVCFFNNDVTMLDYRDFTGGDARTGGALGYWPQGRRMGVDIKRILGDEEITCFISETIQSVRDYLFVEDNCPARGMKLAAEAGRSDDYGFMVHYCPTWGGTGDIRAPGAGIMDDIEERLRWDLIRKHKPPVISFYSIPAVLVKEGAWYDAAAADTFWKRLEEYKSELRRR